MADQLWLSFAFLTASVYATLALLDKVVLEQETSSPFVTAAQSDIPKFAIFVLVGFVNADITPIRNGFTPSVLAPILLAMGVGLINVCGTLIYYRGAEVTDISRFIPLINTDIFFVLLLGGVFLGESFAPPVYMGVGLIFAGTMLISVEDITADIQFVSRRALFFGLSFAAVLALVSLFLKILIPLVGLYEILFWMGAGGIGTIGMIGVFKWITGNFQDGVKDTSILSPGSISLGIGGVVTAIAYFTLVFALESGPVSLVIAITNLEVLLVFFGVIVLSKYTPEVLQESLSKRTLIQKFTASTLMLGGVAIIQLFA